jgi:outer membrane protein
MRKIVISILCFLIFQTGNGQDTLSLRQAIALALEQNYDIRLVATEQAIASNNTNIANAGMLPRITGDVSGSAAIQNTTQTLLSGETRSLVNANSSSLAYGVNLDWTIFDGFRMFTRYDQLQELEKLGKVSMKQAILKTVYDVMNQYFTLAQQQQQLKALETALELSAFRLNMAENRYEIGRASKLEVLAARVDLNTDTTNLLRQQDAYRSTRILLNELLARDVNLTYRVEDSIVITTDLPYEQLATQAEQSNPDLQAAIINTRLAELNHKLVKGNRYPVINVSSAYTLSRAATELGFSTRSRGHGFNYGFNASINIFNGFLQHRNEKNAVFEIEAARTEQEKANQHVQARLLAAYQTYLINLDLVRLEENNQQIAKENLDITLERFKLGNIAPLEFREAQRNFVDASTRYSNAQYEAKLAEVELRQIAGLLTPDF